MANYYKVILDKVNGSTSIRAIELSLAVMADIGPGAFNSNSYRHELELAVEKGEIVELVHIVPDVPSMFSSVYFPKGTKFYSLAGKKL